ncbi:hypothetical protein MMC25_001918 [Agyrium rufum]|nr:hypothetical protein [Agyrium rufum]
MASALAPAPGSLSPATSPRLPSPPPYPEVQLAPPSPNRGISPLSSKEASDASLIDQGAARRVRPGTKAEYFASGPPLIPLSELDSPFQLQEHLKALVYNVTKPKSGRATVPITRETAGILASPPDGIDSHLWLYELCRELVQQTNYMIVALFNASPPCSAKSCPEMRASEWQYLCAVHDPPKSCAAIDYCCHTLDEAGNLLTSQKHFPSRLTLGGEGLGGTQVGFKVLMNIYRRVYRMFAHAWFQHRDAFDKVEKTQGLYVFFKTVCDMYSLIPEDNYTIPPEAEGLASDSPTEETRPGSPEKEDHRPEATGTVRYDGSEAAKEPHQDHVTPDLNAPTSMSTGATTRKHRHTPSTGSLVTTIFEGEEDDGGEYGEEGEEKQETPVVAKAMADNQLPSDKSEQHPSTDTHDTFHPEEMASEPPTNQPNTPIDAGAEETENANTASPENPKAEEKTPETATTAEQEA